MELLLLSCVVVGVQEFVRDLLAPLSLHSLERDAIGILGEGSGEGLATALMPTINHLLRASTDGGLVGVGVVCACRACSFRLDAAVHATMTFCVQAVGGSGWRSRRHHGKNAILE
jgi:hypothetical protein